MMSLLKVGLLGRHDFVKILSKKKGNNLSSANQLNNRWYHSQKTNTYATRKQCYGSERFVMECVYSGKSHTKRICDQPNTYDWALFIVSECLAWFEQQNARFLWRWFTRMARWRLTCGSYNKYGNTSGRTNKLHKRGKTHESRLCTRKISSLCDNHRGLSLPSVPEKLYSLIFQSPVWPKTMHKRSNAE